jgi:hypothetical protein
MARLTLLSLQVSENLVSISTDGRVTQWSIKKGLEHQDLMRLKRLHRRTIPDQVRSSYR